MFKQAIDKTFIGTSEPVTFHNSLSYYGPHGPDANKTTIELSHEIIDNYYDTHVGNSFRIKLSADLTAGVALPSWAVSFPIDEGEITSDTLSLTSRTNNVMGGMLLGAQIKFNMTLEIRSWHSGYVSHSGWYPTWVSGGWGDWDGIQHTLNFDLIPMGVDSIIELADLIPGSASQVLVNLFPRALLDHMQDFEPDALVDESGLFINASIPMKWDLVALGKALAETIVIIGSDVGTPATAAVVAILVELAEKIWKVLNKLKVANIALGPQIDIVFPLRVKITKLIAGYDDAPEAFVYDSLSFDGDTITATNTSATKIAADARPLERIGVHFEQSLELPTIDVGVWLHFSLFWVFAGSPSKDFHLVEILEDKLNFDLGIPGMSFNSAMSNEIGKGGEQNSTGHVPTSIQVNFI